jgi:hypothetical protein
MENWEHFNLHQSLNPTPYNKKKKSNTVRKWIYIDKKITNGL